MHTTSRSRARSPRARRAGAHTHAKLFRTTQPAALYRTAAALLACAALLAPLFVARGVGASGPVKAGGAARQPSRGQEVAGGPASRSESGAGDAAKRAAAESAYGRLPIAFVANDGQFDPSVSFSARGAGHQLFLTDDGAVLSLGAAKGSGAGGRGESAESRERAAVLRMKLAGGRRAASVGGEGPLEGRANYFVGGDPSKWRTNVETYSAVRYEGVYPGVDLVYHGDQRQLEYDFRLAPHADPRQIRIGFDGAHALKIDAEGQLSLRVGGGYVTQRRPVAYQIVGGARREVAARYRIDARGEVGFRLGRYDRALPLVIDPVISYATYLGGSAGDQANAVAVDSAGDAYVVGQTNSTNFPVSGAMQPARAGRADVFVAKLNPAGTALVYSTFLGGSFTDIGYGVAVDAAGDAYVAGVTSSADFPHTAGAFQPAGGGGSDAFVAKLNPAGSALVYSTFLGGNNADTAYGVGVDAAGNAYVAGRTYSTFFNGAATNKHGKPAYRSTDAGATWAADGNGIPDVSITGVTVDPSNHMTLYAAGSSVYKSTDGGDTWAATAPLPAPPGLNFTPYPNSVTVDPAAPSTIYAASPFGVFKSTNAGGSWVESDAGLADVGGDVNQIIVDPSNHATLYAATYESVYKSTDGGSTWAHAYTGMNFTTAVSMLVFDPSNTGTLYAATDEGVYKTTNGAATWAAANNGLGAPSFQPRLTALAIDPVTPSTVYASTGDGPPSAFKTTDGGAHWQVADTGLPHAFGVAAHLAIDPLTPSTLYAAGSFGVFKTTDGGAHWSAANNGLANKYVYSVAVDPAVPSRIYVGTDAGSDAFAAKLDPSGGSLGYFTLLGGDEDDFARGIAVDAAGDAYLAGVTSAVNFPVKNPVQATGGGLTDAFAAKLTPSGSVAYSTYLGGGGYDQGNAVAVDGQGRAYVTGFTSSSNFPVTVTRKQPDASAGDIFVARLAPDGASLDYSFLHGGSDFDDGEGVAADAAGNAYVTGLTDSTDFPLLSPAQTIYGGAFVLKINNDGSVGYSTYLGGSNNNEGYGVAADQNGAAYVAGVTGSGSFPVTSSAFQRTLGGASDAFVAKLQAGVDLALTMTDAPDPVALGSDLTYTIKVVNQGELTATGVRVSDALPAGSSLVSANATQGTCAGTASVTCDLGSLAGGAQATVTITIKPPATRNTSNTATVSANETEGNTDNNTATQPTTVDFTDLSVTASAVRDAVPAGGRAIYAFSVANAGLLSASNVAVDVTLPAGLAFVSCSSGALACAGSGGTRTLSFPSLASRTSQTITVFADASQSLPNGAQLTATAHVAASLPDPDAGNNSASATATVAPGGVRPKRNGKIAFTSFGGGLYVMNEDGSGVTKIYSEPNGNFSLPAWSYDGARIAFVNEIDISSLVTYEIRVVNADGTSPRVLSANATLDSRPAWLPNSSTVTFVRRDRTAVQAVSAVGPPVETSLVSNLPVLDNIAWSPDGSKLLYGTSGGHLFTANIDGSGQSAIANDPNFYDSSPAWSYDGAKIFFERRASGSGSDALYQMNADGTAAGPIPNYQGPAPYFTLSPDGRQIAFGRHSVARMNVDGTNLQQISPAGLDATGPAWQPLPDADPTPTPTPAPTHTISGRVARADGTPPPFGITLDLSGARTASVGTDSNGNYSFTLPEGGSYTVTPRPNQFFDLTPSSRTFNNLTADQPGADFTATPINYSVGGHVTDASGAPLRDIEITLNGGFPSPRTTRTGADGSYVFNGLSPNTSYSVFVSLSSRTSYSFAPDAVAFFSFDQGRARVVDFVGTPLKSIQFSGPNYFVNESDGRASITVTRSGDASAPASVRFQTVDDPAAIRCDDTTTKPGVAFARCDYATTVQDLIFAPGETSKTVTVPVIDDAFVEGPEAFIVRLSNPQGAPLGLQPSAAVTILANDSPGQPNPIDSTDFFVRMQYIDFLSREPEAGQPWSSVINGCAPGDQTCDRVSVSGNFFRSQEFQLKGLFVFKFYKVSFGRLPTYAEIVADMSSVTGSTTAELIAKKGAFTSAWAQRQEFKGTYDSQTNQQFVDALMGRYNLQSITTVNPSSPDDSQAPRVTLTRADLVNGLNASTLTRGQVVRAMADSNEVSAAEFNSAFVAMQYFGYLRRDPEPGGYADWLRTINANPGDIRSMVNGFVNSTEYRLRFGQP